MKEQQIIDILIKYQDTLYGRGSCGELGDSTEAIDSCFFSEIADENGKIWKIFPEDCKFLEPIKPTVK